MQYDSEKLNYSYTQHGRMLKHYGEVEEAKGNEVQEGEKLLHGNKNQNYVYLFDCGFS